MSYLDRLGIIIKIGNQYSIHINKLLGKIIGLYNNFFNVLFNKFLNFNYVCNNTNHIYRNYRVNHILSGRFYH